MTNTNTKNDPVTAFTEHNLCEGFTFIELMIVLALFSGITLLGVVSLDPLIERTQVTQSSQQIIQALQEAQLLAITQFRSYQVNIENRQLRIQQMGRSIPPLIWDQLPESLIYTATRWPSFSPTGFAVGGTIVIESMSYQTEIKISPIGRIRATSITPTSRRIFSD